MAYTCQNMTKSINVRQLKTLITVLLWHVLASELVTQFKVKHKTQF